MCLIWMKTIHFLNNNRIIIWMYFCVPNIVTLWLEYVHNLFMYILPIILSCIPSQKKKITVVYMYVWILYVIMWKLFCIDIWNFIIVHICTLLPFILKKLIIMKFIVMFFESVSACASFDYETAFSSVCILL